MTIRTSCGQNVTSLLTALVSTDGRQQRGVRATPRAAPVDSLIFNANRDPF